MLNHLHLWIIKRGVKDDAPHPLVMFPVRRVVRLLDGLVYVGNGAALDIADVSEGGPPQALGKVALTAPAQDLAVHGDLALVAMGESGLAVVDVSESDEPVVIGTVLETDADVRGVAAGDGYAYLADIALGLRIVDLRDLERPLTAGTARPGLGRTRRRRTRCARRRLLPSSRNRVADRVAQVDPGSLINCPVR